MTSTTNYNQFNRNPDWSYDAESNLISRSQMPNAEVAPLYSYDAADASRAAASANIDLSRYNQGPTDLKLELWEENVDGADIQN